MFATLTKKVFFRPTRNITNSLNILRQMSTEREQQVISNLTKVRQEVEELKGNNTVSLFGFRNQ